MPLLLNDDLASQIVPQKILSPTFFSSSLTGSGKKVGLLNQSRVPARDASTAVISPQACHIMKTTVMSGTSDYEFIPTVIAEFPGTYTVKSVPETAECISNSTVPDDEKTYCLVTTHDMVYIVSDKNDPIKKAKTLCVMYDITFFYAQKNNGQPPVEFKAQTFTEPCLNLQQFTNMAGHVNKNITFQLLNDYFDKLTVYDIVLNTVDLWDSHIPELFRIAIDNKMADDVIVDMAIRLNNYAVNLMDYKEVYDYIEQNAPHLVESVTNVNLNLLLNATLKALENAKATIPTFTQILPYTGADPNRKLSAEQIEAVTTNEPCCIIQAGAGTGKSTTIKERIEYLKYCGVNLANVMVLSFTNAAADHIKEIEPTVNSKTIASMINDIYAANYTHNLSTIDTLCNILEATQNRIPHRQIMFYLLNALKAIRKKQDNKNLVELSSIIAKHFDEVIDILNFVNQTTLELQAIICYHAKNLVEPTIACEHLIMDEVQDNSIFEFIYVINYIIRHNACLYLVGDCSQTLFEFRASNPKALNCLEMSGVFKCMKLQTNYRSNQNILDFANLTLNTIEANQYAKIQLQANSFVRNPFGDDVSVKYRQLRNKTTDLDAAMPTMIFNIKDWIQDKFNKHEQVAFLAYKRAYLDRFEEIVDIQFPNNSLINITPAKQYANSYFSKYILCFGDDYSHKTGNDATVEIMRHIIYNIDKLCKNDAQKNTLKNLVSEWANLEKATANALDVQLQNNLITADDLKSKMFQSLIDFEIEKNAMKSRIISAANEEKKQEDYSDYDFIVSTIHSAKGLEFDNVILFYDEAGAKNSEEDKRMYYVGLTRAKNTECVLAYNTTVGSEIKERYDTMLALSTAAANAAVVADESDEDDNAATAVITTDDTAETSTSNDADANTAPVVTTNDETTDTES